jgi:uncharacterized protein (TIGR02246 family)
LTRVILLAAAALATASAQSAPGPEREILALEQQAMEGWQKGDPDPLLAMLAPDITYFHVMTDQRLEGREAVKALFESYRGRPLFDSYQIAEPRLQLDGGTGVLTYTLVTHNGDVVRRWNATQVYRKTGEGWRVIHTHWSQVRPPRP